MPSFPRFLFRVKDRHIEEEAKKMVSSFGIKDIEIRRDDTIKDAMDGNFTPGTVIFGLKEDGVGLAPTTDKNTPQEVIDQANALGDKIIAGEIVVPSTEEELESFTPPQ